jgi:hypothetical protein
VTPKQIILELNDKSGNSRHMVQATGTAQPAYTTAGINGLNCLTYDNSTDTMSTSGTITLAQPFTIVSVLKASSTTNEQVITNGTAAGVSGPRVNTNWTIFAGIAADSGVAADTNLHLVVCVFNGASSLIRVDGAQVGGSLNPSTNGWSAQAISLGRPSTVFYGGDLGETLLIPSAVSGTNLTDLETYLSDKWGTP